MWPFSVGRGEIAHFGAWHSEYFDCLRSAKKRSAATKTLAKESEVARHGTPWKIPFSWHNLYN